MTPDQIDTVLRALDEGGFDVDFDATRDQVVVWTRGPGAVEWRFPATLSVAARVTTPEGYAVHVAREVLIGTRPNL